MLPTFCVCRGYTRAGLGNELLVWGKCWLASQALGGMCIPPAWGMNPRGYGKYFRTSRLDVLRNAALPRLLPSFRFTAEEYRATGCLDYGEAVSHWAARQNRLPWALEVEGMWGGYYAIRRAREYVRGQLLATRWTQENVAEYSQNVDSDRLQIAFHIRRGDFSTPVSPEEYAGRFNLAVPMEWYLELGRQVVRQLGPKRVQFTVVSDASWAELAPFRDELQALTTAHQKNRDISDLLILASADILACSISSYSLFAAFLSRGPYLWYEPQLRATGSLSSIWGADPDQLEPGSPTQRHRASQSWREAAVPRGMPVPANGSLPKQVLELLHQSHRPAHSDLIYYGLVPRERRMAEEAVSKEYSLRLIP